MDIANVWVNREMQTGKWYPILHCRRWHQRLRLWVIKLIIKSLAESKDICQTRLDTGG